MRVLLRIAYNGAGFAGWATQPGLRTVQGELEAALATVLRVDQPRITVAGRTDAGVHARGQVAHVDLPRAAVAAAPGRSDRDPLVALRQRVNAVLQRDAGPISDVVVADVAAAPAGFDARFSAIWRRYSYRISDADSTRDPLRADVTWVRPRNGQLDVAAMDAAAAQLRGEHDFLPYCKPRVGATTIRTLLDFDWQRVEAGADAGLLVARVRADAFCHSMVRSLVGACLAVGEGRRDPSWPAELLVARERTSHITVAPAQGLTLEEVAYPPEAELAERAQAARATRGEVYAGKSASAKAREAAEEDCGCG
ncbi:MAG: tRNA pseudouridine(38-40) synthase TruA [Buchananella hordeovulneris]|nr:tRNA pseudouridine(38-40) synthase TruA [Buchananella hordeovulneris]